MSDIRSRMAGALRGHYPDSGGYCTTCDQPVICSHVHLVDVLLSLPGISIMDSAETLQKLRYNSHDLGEFGTFIRLEYASNILAAAVQAQEGQ